VSADLENPRLVSLADSISAGTRVEWEEVQQHVADQRDVGVLQELRLIEEIARFHRIGDSDSELSGPSTTGREGPASIEAVDAGLPTWGHFAIIEQVGAGAFGAVYRATDTTLQREVALKLLWPAGPENPATPSRVLKEARLLARVRHPNVVSVYGADQIDDRVGLWMEFIRGRTLAALVRTQGPFGAREAALVGLDLCRALAAVHQAGLLHGDIKAHNVMREERGRTVLMDFGTGKDVQQDLPGDPPRWHDDFAGTPLYLAPEVFEGRPRTQAADLYSVGVLLYHLVTGAYPVKGQTREQVERAHRRQERARLRDARPDLPDTFVRVVERALADDPGQRYQSAGALEAALAHFLASPAEPGLTKGRRWAIAAAVAAAAMSVLSLSYWSATRGIRSEHNIEDPAAIPTSVSSPSPKTSPAVLPESAYKIDAMMYRRQQGGERRLRPGDRVSPGDELFFRVRVSRPTYIYVVNQDDHGETYLLFPLPEWKLTNPLPAGRLNRLPGAPDGQQMYWQVSSAGGREHFLIVANPERWAVFEQFLAGLPHPERNRPPALSARLSPEAVGVLRGVGGLTGGGPSPSSGPLLTDQFATPLGEREEDANGLWLRQITFENPIK